MKVVNIAILLTSLFIISCGDNQLGPTPITTPPISVPPPPTTEPPVKPIVASPFSWNAMAGFTAFALGKPGQTEQDVESLYFAALGHGFNTGRICSENEFWDGPGMGAIGPRS